MILDLISKFKKVTETLRIFSDKVKRLKFIRFPFKVQKMVIDPSFALLGSHRVLV